ncbi:MAG: VWA domain-containing protein [bacterium]|nr:VWA domain-containing protein [bacterium]
MSNFELSGTSIGGGGYSAPAKQATRRTSTTGADKSILAKIKKKTSEKKAPEKKVINRPVHLTALVKGGKVVNVKYDKDNNCEIMYRVTAPNLKKIIDSGYYSPYNNTYYPVSPGAYNTESYEDVVENEFLPVSQNPLSTFSIDVDTASYSNVRRFLNNGGLPPNGAVRIEEMINYFSYDYPQPGSKDPFSVNYEISRCPWNKDHQLVLMALQGKRIKTKNIPPRNIVLLLDVSGSMNDPNKLPLLKKSMKLLVKQLRKKDHIAVVVYAGAAGVVLPPTSGNRKKAIMSSLYRLEAGGSTAGGAGIQLAYKLAKKHFRKKGINRIILGTDGDFNVGISSQAELVKLIEKKRRTGVFLTVLGFGMGNYKDAAMEKLANKGNGNYAYIDTFNEAYKVMVQQLGATLITIAKDVKIQVEFNPQKVKSYRLIGYENRMLEDKDFEDDTKDAGEIGAGHSVTVLYEIVPGRDAGEAESDELVYLKLRYKQPHESQSSLITVPIKHDVNDIYDSSNNLKFSSAVAGFAMLLRDSKFKGELDYSMVKDLAKSGKGRDKYGYRSEFLKLVKLAENLK